MYRHWKAVETGERKVAGPGIGGEKTDFPKSSIEQILEKFLSLC